MRGGYKRCCTESSTGCLGSLSFSSGAGRPQEHTLCHDEGDARKPPSSTFPTDALGPETHEGNSRAVSAPIPRLSDSSAICYRSRGVPVFTQLDRCEAVHPNASSNAGGIGVYVLHNSTWWSRSMGFGGRQYGTSFTEFGGPHEDKLRHLADKVPMPRE